MAKRGKSKKRKGSKRKNSKTSNNLEKSLKISQRGFLWSLVIAIITYVIYFFSQETFLGALFGILFIVFGFLGLAFLISLIVIWISSKK